MTIDKQKLKVLAQAVANSEDQPELEAEHAEARDALWLHMHCHTILALLAEIERLEGCDKAYKEAREKARGLQSEMDDVMSERDQFAAELAGLRERWAKETDENYKVRER